MRRPIASLSLDLDNRWAYQRSHGRDEWREYTSYLPTVADRVEAFLRESFPDRAIAPLTLFVVGKDLEFDENRAAVARLASAGCEIGNHSQNHYPWLATLTGDELECEVADAEQAIEQLTGTRPVGFRAPGFSWSPELLELLVRRGYQYDSSMFPTSIGPLASLYVRLTRRKPTKSATGPDQQFASLRDSFRTLRPHLMQTASGPLVEIPVTTMPLARVPIHVTYLTFLAQKSKRLASAYLSFALGLCRLRGVGPAMLLHPLDFLGQEDEPTLDFFPGMKLSFEQKQSLLAELITKMLKRFDISATGRQAIAELPQSVRSTADTEPKESAPAVTL